MAKPVRTDAKLTPREITFIRNFIKTGNMTKAAIAAGSPSKNAGRIGWGMMRRVRTKIGETLENHGITPDYVIERILKPGLEATKHTFFAGEVVDHEQRGKYADRIFKLTGLFANEPPNSGDGLERAPITINLAFLGPERAEAVLKAARESTLERDRGQPILDAEHDPHQG